MARVARLIDELISIAQVLIHALIAGSRRASSARMTAPGCEQRLGETATGINTFNPGESVEGAFRRTQVDARVVAELTDKQVPPLAILFLE